jgi:DNA processing protein
MTPALSPNSQAILLLIAPLVAGRADASKNLLTLTEYNRLGRLLREKQRQPADLIGPDGKEAIGLVAPAFGKERIDALLGRGFLLSHAVDHWAGRGIWVVSRADPTYPRRLKNRLKEDAPPILYGCGEPDLLESGGLAVVGSRHIDDELTEYAEKIGALAAAARRTVISGAAKGIDRAAMHGALRSGGAVIGVMADSLERAALARDNREPLMDRRLVFVSPYDPAAGFNVGHAMQRNKAIYALADAALVVTSDFEKGGTWTGAIEQLDRLRFAPIFVRNSQNAGRGNSALIQRGGRAWPEPENAAELNDAISRAANAVAAEPRQDVLPLSVREEPRLRQSAASDSKSKSESATPGEVVLQTVTAILTRELSEPRTQTEVADMLGITKVQAKAWLSELAKRGVVEKLTKPVRYRTAQATPLL